MTQHPDKTPQSQAARPSVSVGASGTLAEPIVLGDYELRRKIGHGGMGTVYAAWQRSLQRFVAVKVLGQHVSASSSAVVRFQREAQAAGKLNHAHIVPIFGAGEIDGVHFYAMELIDGPGLNTVIQQAHGQPAPDSDSGDLVETLPLDGPDSKVPPVAQGSARGGPRPLHIRRAGSRAASFSLRGHPRGLKPAAREHLYSSVAHHMATVADALDYAHRQGVIHRDIKPHNLILGNDGKLRISDFGLARVTEQPGVTVTGEMLGSPLYMSPEQITRSPGEVDHRTDIYSLGATMYEWLTASAPYPGETREQVISKILTSEPRSLRSHDPLIPIDLETICLKAIDRDPNHRYQTAGDLREDLARYVKHRPIKARRAGVATRTRKFIDRHRLATLATGALAVAIALTAALVIAERRVKTQTAVAQQATQDREKIEDLLSLLPLELGGPLRLVEAARPMIEDAVGAANRSNPVVAGDREEGRAIDVSTVASPRGIAQRAYRDLFRVVMPGALATREAGPPDECTSQLRQAFNIWEDDPASAEQLVEGCLAANPDDFGAHQFRAVLEAIDARFDSVVLDTEAMIRISPSRPLAFAWRALAFIMAGDATRSLFNLERAAELGDVLPWGPAFRGLALSLAERYADAISAFDNALERDPDLMVALLGRAHARSALGNVDGVVDDLTQALKIEPDNADLLALRGDYFVTSEDYDAAKGDYDRAMAIAGPTTSIVIRYLLALRGTRTP